MYLGNDRIYSRFNWDCLTTHTFAPSTIHSLRLDTRVANAPSSTGFGRIWLNSTLTLYLTYSRHRRYICVQQWLSALSATRPRGTPLSRFTSMHLCVKRTGLSSTINVTIVRSIWTHSRRRPAQTINLLRRHKRRIRDAAQSKKYVLAHSHSHELLLIGE